MATKAEIKTTARNYLRDFPKFFRESYPVAGTFYELGKPNIDSTTLYVAYVPNSGGTASSLAASTGYTLDTRNGLLRTVNQLATTNTLMVEGYYYEWLSDADLDFYADMAINLNTHNIKIPLENMAPAVADVVGIHCLVQALWGLLSEFARDIDVISSESVHIMASQRYRMVSDLLEYWTSEYNKRAQALNIGLERLEVINLRRISRTTNRLVPLYKAREVGDYGPIERIWVEPDDGVIQIEQESDDNRTEVYVDGEPPPGYLSTGQY